MALCLLNWNTNGIDEGADMKRNFDITGIGGFRSSLAPKLAPLAAVGFLGFLGFVPGFERLFGLSGFFGFIGAAYIVEAIYRLKSSKA
jgi:hypothetical protein